MLMASAPKKKQSSRADRAREIALYRYALIRPLADPALSASERGKLVRQLASQVHLGPFGEPVTVSRATLDRWIRAWRSAGFDALIPAEAQVEPRTLLVHFLREQLNLTGTHVGCDTSQCGACTVLVDGRSAKSCTMFAVQVDGSDVTTIEGLAKDGQLHPLQNGFWEEHGLQCGYCTPGMIMAGVNLLGENPNPNEREIREGLSGNFCRCTGYQHIVNAVQNAAGRR